MLGFEKSRKYVHVMCDAYCDCTAGRSRLLHIRLVKVEECVWLSDWSRSRFDHIDTTGRGRL